MTATPRFLIYAKADKDAQTTEWFEEWVVLPLIRDANIWRQSIDVLVQSAFVDQKLRIKHANPHEPYIEVKLKGRYQRYALEKLTKLQDLAETNYQLDSRYDMATVEEMTSFLAWATNKVPLGPTDTLNLWGHGSASSILYRMPLDILGWMRWFSPAPHFQGYLAYLKKGPSEITLLQPRELAYALKSGPHKPSVIVLTACRVGSLEFAYDLKDVCDYLVASTTIVHPRDWDYATWLSDSVPAGQLSGLDFAKQLLASMPDKLLSIIQTSKTADCAKAIDAFIAWLQTPANSTDQNWKVVVEARSDSTAYQDGEDDTIAVDLGAFFAAISGNSRATPTLKQLANAAHSAIAVAVVQKTPYPYPNSELGISLVFPTTRDEFSEMAATKNGRYDITKKENAGSTYIQNSRWLEFLEAFWKH